MISKERASEIAAFVEAHGETEACKHFHMPEETLSRYLRVYRSYNAPVNTMEVIETGAEVQKLRDLNQVLRKETREQYRLYNVLETVYDEYIKALRESKFADFTMPTPPTVVGERQGIFHISDTHFNELIYGMESNGNVFDFPVASKRLQKAVNEAKVLYKAYGVTNVTIICTGDLINSNRRLSEKLAQATSQVRASLLATYLLQQVIIDMASDFAVSFAGVVGNESRLGMEDFDSSDALASENWDYLIYNQLKMLFDEKPVEFIDGPSAIQMVVTLDNGFNALLVHGNYLKGGISDKQIGVLLQQYAYRGIPIHGVFCGHIHSAAVGDIISRSSSLCGGNAYSTNDLMFVSRASQNAYIVNPDLSYNGMKIDVQNTDGYKGYNIIQELERYNVRGATPTTRVVIENCI